MRLKHPDKKNALSLLNASEKQMKYTLSLSLTDESAFTIIRNIYECFRMIGEAILLAEGKVSQDHVQSLEKLEELKVQTTRPIRIIDSLRKMRHGINYYGYTPTKAEADYAVLFAKECFLPILMFARSSIEK